MSSFLHHLLPSWTEPFLLLLGIFEALRMSGALLIALSRAARRHAIEAGLLAFEAQTELNRWKNIGKTIVMLERFDGRNADQQQSDFARAEDEHA
jgi:hypothetical protein